MWLSSKKVLPSELIREVFCEMGTQQCPIQIEQTLIKRVGSEERQIVVSYTDFVCIPVGDDRKVLLYGTAKGDRTADNYGCISTVFIDVGTLSRDKIATEIERVVAAEIDNPHILLTMMNRVGRLLPTNGVLCRRLYNSLRPSIGRFVPRRCSRLEKGVQCISAYDAKIIPFIAAKITEVLCDCNLSVRAPSP